jgi:FixJ family two-component response regulator
MGVIDHQASEKTTLILLSDDDASVRRSLHLLLRSRGFGVLAYASGTALLLDPQIHAGNCLVVDYLMPDLDGISILRQLRSAGWCGAAILITAHCTKKLAECARQAGFAAVLEKPLRDGVLVQTIREVSLPNGEPEAITASE